METKIKVCGLTNYEDAEYAVNLGADFLGFIQYPKSARFISFDKVHKIVTKLRSAKNNYKFKVVGVFVNEPLDSIIDLSKHGVLDIFQFHGDESIEYFKNVQIINKVLWKAIRINNNTTLDKIISYQDADKYLFDTFIKDLYGGTGESFDWSIIDSFCEKLVKKNNIILSGGIDLKNIVDAVKKKLYAVDINSSIEISPGKKDYIKMEKLFEIIRNCENYE